MSIEKRFLVCLGTAKSKVLIVILVKKEMKLRTEVMRRPTVGILVACLFCTALMNGAVAQNACETECVRGIYANNCGQASCITGISSSADVSQSLHPVD